VGAPHAEYMINNDLTFDEYIMQLAEKEMLSYTAGDGTFYAIYFSNYNNSALLAGNVVSVSSAMPGQGKYIITTIQANNALLDIAGHWGESYIRELVQAGIIIGYEDHTFRPNRSITKAELTTMLSRLLLLLNQTGNPGDDADSEEGEVGQEEDHEETIPAIPLVFNDVTVADYYYDAVWIVHQAGLLDESLYRGNGDGTVSFIPGEIMRRKQVAIMLAGLFLERAEEAFVNPRGFSDVLFYEEKIIHAVDLLAFCNIITGDTYGKFNPEGNITRAEICTIFSRIIHYFRLADR